MTIPTYTQLYNSVLTDLQAKLGITNIIGKVVLSAFSAVQAGKLKLVYIVANSVQRNLHPDTADEETLLRIGNVRLKRAPFAGVAGEYTATVTGTIGAVIPPGTTFKSLDSSTSPDKLFVLDTMFTFITGTGTINLRSYDAVNEARLEVADQVQVTAPIANVNSYATIASVVVAPSDAETIEQYRTAILESYQLEPNGGNKADYILWSKEVAGIRKSYPYVISGAPGEVEIFIEAYPADSTDNKGTPSGAKLTLVENEIEERRPMGTFDVDVKAIVLKAIDVDIVNLSPVISLDAVEVAIENYLYNIRPYIDGADNPSALNASKLFASQIFNVVFDAIGSQATFDSVTVEVSGTPITMYEFDDGKIPYLDHVTYS